MRELTLTQAAARLGRSYNQVLRLVLLGVLHGKQRDGRWAVSRESVERFLHERDSTDAPGFKGGTSSA